MQTSDGKSLIVDVAGLPAAQTLAGPWDVRFAPGWGRAGIGRLRTLDSLERAHEQGIKYFGTATYRKSFDLDETQAKGLVRLHLGEVKYVAGCGSTASRSAWSGPLRGAST